MLAPLPAASSKFTVEKAKFVTGSVFILLQLQLPSFAAVEGNVCWDPKNNIDFDYQARGKLRVERQECQVSGSSAAF